MDEGKIEAEVQSVENSDKKGFDFKKINFKKIDFKSINFKEFNYKKYLPVAGIVLAVIMVITIIASVFGGGPKKAVKNYINGMNEKNAKKVVKSIDAAGIQAWGYNYNADNFSPSDYKEFIADYKGVDKSDIKDTEEQMIDSLDDSFVEMKKEYKSFKMKIEKFKKVEKLGNNLYSVKAKVSIIAKSKDKSNDLDESATITFVVYKDKIISLGNLGYLY